MLGEVHTDVTHLSILNLARYGGHQARNSAVQLKIKLEDN